MMDHFVDLYKTFINPFADWADIHTFFRTFDIFQPVVGNKEDIDKHNLQHQKNLDRAKNYIYENIF